MKVSRNHNENFRKMFAALQYCASSVGIMIALKITLTVYAFPSPLFIAFSQACIQVVVLSLLRFAKVIQFPSPSMTSLRAIMPLPLIQGVGIATGLAGTKALSIPMFTVLRRTAIPLTLWGEAVILKKVTSNFVKGAVALISLGTIVASLNDLSFNLNAYIIILASAFSTACNGVISALKLSGPQRRSKWELLWYSAAVTAVGTGVYLPIRGDIWEIVKFPFFQSSSFFFSFACSCTLGTYLQYAIVTNHQVNGPLSTTILGCAKNVLTTFAGILGFGNDYIFTISNFVGVNISLIGSLVYAWAKVKQKSSQHVIFHNKGALEKTNMGHLRV